MLNIAQYFPITDPTLIFFVVMIIILFAPIIMGKLRIPHIIGMVLAGVLIGKYGLNILERDSSFELFGKVGLYYIMFLAALEMDMEGMKKKALPLQRYIYILVTIKLETTNDKMIKRRVKARPKSTTYTGYFVELDLSKI